MNKDIALVDGLIAINEAQMMTIKSYDVDLKACDGQLQLVKDGKADCEEQNRKKDEVIVDQDGKIHTVKVQRNVLGGGMILLLIVLIII